LRLDPPVEQVQPVPQEQLERASQFGHSFARTSLFPPEQKNDTGLPDSLKTGIETLSDFSMDEMNFSPKITCYPLLRVSVCR